MSNYIGITTGPVVDTLMLAKSPAATWYASYMFSSLTANICAELKTLSGDGMQILSPYYTGKTFDDGIGRYHDRIIIKNVDKDSVSNAIENAQKKIAEDLADDLKLDKSKHGRVVKFMNDYFQIHYACLDNAEDDGAAIIELGYILDYLEQMPSPSADNSDHPILRLFDGTKESRNKYINEKVKKLEIKSQLTNKKGAFKSLPDISRTSTELKYGYYYAVVEADGDGMGTYIQSLDDNITIFSKHIFNYAGEAAKLIGNFGGMTVYAGGDDLFFIAPVCSKDGRSVFDLCHDISKKFNEKIKEAQAEYTANKDTKNEPVSLPTMSFGVAIRHEGFPLYEALNSSISALEMAKSKDIGKNTMIIDLQKGSGQALKIAVPFDKYDEEEKDDIFDTGFNNIFKLYLTLKDKENGQSDKSSKETETGKDKNDILKSAIYVFNERKAMFDYKPLTSEIIQNIITNTFDNSEQKKYDGFIKELSNELVKFLTSKEKKVRAYDNGTECVPIKAFEALLRLSKFMIEKKGADDREQVSDQAKAG